MYLLDTNVIINFLRGSLPTGAAQAINNIVDDQCNISVITKMEALGFNFPSASDQSVMETFLNGSNVININSQIVNKTIE